LDRGDGGGNARGRPSRDVDLGVPAVEDAGDGEAYAGGSASYDEDL